eukprot:augustus_masked-scaffold_150-processed-gene-0.0-mRNA-1 protein AED:1.00 eAED:1.00 QI:0/-1/0/0/-1/1/1/0/73
MVRIFRFHRKDPGSIPGVGRSSYDSVPEWLTGRPAKALLFERQSSNLCAVDWKILWGLIPYYFELTATKVDLS